MRRKKIKSKVGLLFTILVLLLSSLVAIGGSYGFWYDTLTVEGDITTGTWTSDETAWARMYNYPNNFTHEFPGSNWATYIKCRPDETIQTFYLYADQKYRVGVLNVNVSKDGDYLYVEYDLDDGYNMSVSHLHVATSLGGFPNGGDNPPPGHFAYSKNHDGPDVTGYTYDEILWDESWDGVDLYIGAHAVVWGTYV